MKSFAIFKALWARSTNTTHFSYLPLLSSCRCSSSGSQGSATAARRTEDKRSETGPRLRSFVIKIVYALQPYNMMLRTHPPLSAPRNTFTTKMVPHNKTGRIGLDQSQAGYRVSKHVRCTQKVFGHWQHLFLEFQGSNVKSGVIHPIHSGTILSLPCFLEQRSQASRGGQEETHRVQSHR